MSRAEVDVVLIGGGIAGLVAADELKRNGFSVVVLEATDRLGGRCGATDLWGIESGAEFVHGEGAATWELLDRFELEATPFPPSLGDARKYIPDFPRLAEIVDWICEECENQYRVTGGSLAGFIDVLSPTEAELGSIPLSEFKLAETTAKLFAKERIERIEGCDLRDLPHSSYVEQSLISSTATRNFRVKGGYGVLISKLSSGLDVRLNFPVQSLRTVGSTVTARSGEGGLLEARFAIVTVPISGLRKGAITFSPPLPSDKIAALSRIEMGVATKVSVGLDSSIGPTFHMLHTLEAIPTWFNLGQNTERGVTNLLGFCGGSYSKRLARVEEADLPNLIYESLLRAIPELRPTMIREPVVVHRWDNAPFIHGAYSYPGLDGLTAARRFARPEGLLHFAGEATSINGNIGTVHGAVESGRRVAMEISERIRRRV